LRKSNVPEKLGIALVNRGIVVRDMRDFVGSQTNFEEALMIASNNGFDDLIASTHMNMAIVSLQKGRRDDLYDAYGLLHEALQYFQGKDPRMVGYVNGNLGIAVLGMSYYVMPGKSGMDERTEALKYHEKAFAIFEALQDKNGIANETANLGHTMCSMGKFNEGIGKLENAVKLHSAIPNMFGLATDYRLLGSAYFEQRDKSNAKKNLLAARAIYKNISEDMVADIDKFLNDNDLLK
jgi:tetratricopeptide (TPR) repeat protein